MSETTVRNLQPVLPIPTGSRFLEKSDKPRISEASLDGKTFQAPPLKRKVRRPGQGPIDEEVPVFEYRSLRWVVGDLASGKSTTVRVQVQLDFP